MPHQPNITEIRVNNILACLAPTVTLLDELTRAFDTPFLQAISTQQDRHKLKYFFRQNEMSTLWKNCQVGLDEAVKVFEVETGLTITTSVAKMQKKAQSTHKELLELVENLSDGSTSDSSSAIYQSNTGSKNSSNSLSMLPAEPKIFHGRQSEIEDILTSLGQQSAHIAILGAGGIGKTSLARAVLHDPQIAAKYEHRFFVAADSSTTSIELAALTGSHLGLKPGKDLTKSVVQFLSRGPPCLLILDNLETPWEPLESRDGVEEFLSLITDIPHLALIITMRGAERPAKTFIEIADDCHDPKDINQLLQLTDNMPLAVDLIAHLVDYEGCSNVLARWKTEKTSLLSTGYDKQSSLDASIIMSLGSPRMTPGAKDLLSLLSILPDGLSDAELVQSELPIQDLLGCQATLLRTSLAYSDDKQRLKSLVPIREHIQSFSPPSQPLFHPLCKYFQSVMDLYEKYRGTQLNNTRIDQLTANLGNLHQLLLLEFHIDSTEVADTINCTLSLNTFHQLTGHGRTALMDNIPAAFPQPCDHQLEARYVIETLYTIFHYPVADLESLVQKGIAHFHHINDPVLEARFYLAVGNYWWYIENDFVTSRQSYEKALSLAQICGDSRQHALALARLAMIKWSMGDYHAALMHAQEARQVAQLSANLHQEAVLVELEARCLMDLGNLTESLLLCHRARELLQLCGMQGGQADHSVMNALAEVHRMKSEYLEAHSIHTVVQNTSAQQDPLPHVYTLLNIAELDIMIGVDTLEVQHKVDNAKAIFSTLRIARSVNQCEMILGDLHLREGNEMVAKPLFQQCLNAAWGNDNQTITYCLEKLADISCWTSTADHLLYRWPVIYLVHVQKTQEKMALYKALRFLGDIFLSEGDEHTAHNLFVVTLEGFTYMDVHRSRGDCMLRLGDIAKNRGDLSKAVELWKEAHPLFERSSQAKDMAKIDTRLALIKQEISDAHQESLALLNRLDRPMTSVDEPSIASDIKSEDAIFEN
ncbi:hypothetical protein C8R44DRAFT_731378 [Mycena epipterygia]|nr:hypothetical protein C8R44DRAFT_731378 [Mycena epipterygia]